MPGTTMNTTPADARLPLFAVAAPGLEPIVARELADLGVEPVIERGGVAWEGTLSDLYDANLRLRTASRILMRFGQFRARTFPELQRHTRRIPWSEFMTPGREIQLRVSSRKSRLYHEGAIAERIRGVIEEQLGAPATMEETGPATEDPDDEGARAQLVVVRFHYDRCTISLDSSGALLHRRGYRLATAKAPLRETLAAALILASDWDRKSPLLDPLCGSGTIPIEAALIARGIAPGLAHPPDSPRRYAFQEWPGYDVGLWDEIITRAREEIAPAAPTIIGADRDAGAIAAAAANAERAGVPHDVVFLRQPLSALQPPEGTGALVTNPPYGLRIGEKVPLRNLYAALGRIAKERLPGWRFAFISADRSLDRQLRIPLEYPVSTRNGGISVSFGIATISDRFRRIDAAASCD